jgi:signal transduction histidine kinase
MTPALPPVRAAVPPLALVRGTSWREPLHRAADVAVVALTDEGYDGGWPETAARLGTTQVVAMVESMLLGATQLGVPLSPSVPAGLVIRHIRRAVIAGAAAGEIRADDALHILQALETLNDAVKEDTSHRFTSRLGGAGGLQLLVDVAHDMRSPLGSILFLAEQVRRGHSGPVTPAQERQLGLIYGAAFGLSTMASDVIDVARGGERLAQAEAQPFAIPSVFQQVRDLLCPMADERGLTLSFDTTLGDARLGQRVALHRVLVNLVTNAVKFTERGSVTVTATAVRGARVRFEVRDTGRGIPSDVLGTLFDAFRRRLKPGEYVFSSAGLGLSICQTLLRAMGAELLVETSAGAGSAFSFELDLPRHRVD